MSNWNITMSGSGPNKTGDASSDVHLLAVEFIRSLQRAGHDISDARVKDVTLTDKSADLLLEANTVG